MIIEFTHICAFSFSLLLSLSLSVCLRQVAEDIRPLINEVHQTIPTILEIPSKDHPYDEAKDPIMQRVSKLLGRE